MPGYGHKGGMKKGGKKRAVRKNNGYGSYELIA